MNTLITKSDCISKLRIAQKKNHACKKWASGQFQSTQQIWPRLKKVELFKHNMMWCEILRSPLFLAYCASFMSICPLLRKGWGGGLHILHHIKIEFFSELYGKIPPSHVWWREEEYSFYTFNTKYSYKVCIQSKV